jgi:trk system potassium uptake protein TrkA
MKIIIVGAGRIGKNLSKSLAEEQNEVFVIEKNEKRAQSISEKLDVKVILGNGADPEILKKAEVEKADLVLAVTTSDETNLVVSHLAGSFGAKRRIARVRNTSLSQAIFDIGYKEFQINEIINPELVAAQAIVKIIKAPGAHGVVDFANGKLLLCSFDVTEQSALLGQTIGEFRDEDFPWPFLIIAIIRDNEIIIPSGDTKLKIDDRIYVLIPSNSLAEILTIVNPEIRMPKKVVISGANITGEYVAKTLSKYLKEVILLEEDPQIAEEVAGRLESVRVLCGSAVEADMLTECGIEAADVFVATSSNEQSNLISSVLAKKMGVKTTIISSQQEDYMALIDALDVDAIINPHYLAVERILHLARGKGISSVAKLIDCETEALEFIPEPGSLVTQSKIKDITFPKNSIVGAVYSGDNVQLASGDTEIKPGEKVVIFAQESAVKKLQKLFTNT